jgi:hypothetical protein
MTHYLRRVCGAINCVQFSNETFVLEAKECDDCFGAIPRWRPSSAQHSSAYLGGMKYFDIFIPSVLCGQHTFSASHTLIYKNWVGHTC